MRFFIALPRVLSSETGRTGGTNMYAVIKTGGKQYKVSVDDEIFVEKLEGEAGSQVTFDEVLAVSDDNGIVAGDVKATVTGEIVKQGRNKKVIVSKYKAKKGYRRKSSRICAIYANGHAGYDDSGRDIICSAVSTLLFTAASALEDICGYDSESFFRISNEGCEDVNLRITVPDQGDDETKDRAQVIMRTCELGLIGIARDYNSSKKKYVEIINSKTPEV